MGTNTLAVAGDGTIIPASDHNSLVEALKDTLVPRDTTTLAPTDLAGDLGATTTRWDNAYIKKLILGTIASSLSIEEDGSNRIIIKVGGSTALTIDSGGLIPNTVATDMIQNNAVTQAKLGTAAYFKTATCGPFSTTSTSNVQVTNLSSSLTSYGRPVFLSINSGDVSTGGADILVDTDTAYISFYRDSTQLCTYVLDADTVRQSGFSWTYLDPIGAGTYTYSVKARTRTGTTFQIYNYNLSAFEV